MTGSEAMAVFAPLSVLMAIVGRGYERSPTYSVRALPDPFLQLCPIIQEAVRSEGVVGTKPQRRHKLLASRPSFGVRLSVLIPAR